MFKLKPVFFGIAALLVMASLLSSNNSTRADSEIATTANAGPGLIAAVNPGTDTISLADPDAANIFPEQGLPIGSIEPPGQADGECPGTLPGDDSSLRILGVSTSLSSTNALIQNFRVQLGRPGQVWVEYHPKNKARDVLQTRPTLHPGTEHQFQVMRLTADTEYCYQVYARSNSGTGPVSDSFPGLFVTGPTPAGLADSNFRRIVGTQS
jgi:hypothetical protein